jgi:hypothetical protein
MYRSCITALLGSLSLFAGSLALAPSPASAKVAQVTSSLGCVTTTVTESQAPTGPSMAEGGHMTFADPIAKTPPGKLTSVYILSGQMPVAAVHQHVRVCLVETPDKDSQCDPATDSRGRLFLVMNLDSPGDDGADVYQNSEHGCGGA